MPRPSTRRSTLRRLPPALALALLLGVAAPADVAAHAELISSTPAANESLPASPEELALEFTEPIDPVTATVEVLDERRGSIEDVGPVATDPAGTLATVSLPELAPGVYTVSYRVVSAVDGHVTAGIFAFLVDPTGTEPAPTQPSETASPSVDAGTIVARWIALLTALVAFGTVLFWAVSVRRLRVAAGIGPAPWLAVAITAFATFAALAVYLTLAARSFLEPGGGHGGHGGATGFPLDFAAPFGWTPFAIAMRVALLGSLATFSLAIGRFFHLAQATSNGAAPSPTHRGEVLVSAAVLAAAGLSLLGMSFAGHVAAAGGPLSASIDWFHLVAVGAWLGPLPAVGMLAWRCRRGSLPVRKALRDALRRHSRLALVAAPLVALTGIANSPLVIGQQRDLVASDYGNLLLAKVLLFGVAVGIGAANHFVVRAGRLRRAIVPLLAGEVAVTALAVAVAATMVTIQPAAGRLPTLSAPPVNAAHLYGAAGPATVHAAVNLPAPGNQRYQVAIADAATGAPRDDVQLVFAVFRPPMESGLPEERVELAPREIPGLYETSGAYTPIVGDWELELIVRRQGQRDESVTFSLTVMQPLPPERLPPPDTGLGVPVPLVATWQLLPAGWLGWVPALLLLALVAALTFAARRARWASGPERVARVVLLVLAISAGLGAGSRSLVEAANRPPAEAAARISPVEATAASVERGGRVYRANCQSCHGADGLGTDATIRTAPPGDLPRTVATSTDGELAWWITTGIAGTQMPGFASTLSEHDRWDLVNHLRDRWPDP